MAKRPVATSANDAASEQDLLLATKLFLPQPQPESLPRQRLLDLLDGALAHELTLVCAPAGFGKTTLLAEWVRRGGSPAGWLSLDGGDNDPAGSGATCSRRWIGRAPVWPSESCRYSGHRRRRPSTGW
jgi:LuxR family maltose regulon positive regulatory protein